MASRRVTDSSGRPRRPPATSPEDDEGRLISLATDLAAKQLADGTASSQIMVHYLKLGSSRERLEQERLALEAELAEAKIEAMASAHRVEALYEDAIKAMRSYAGYEEEHEDDYED